MQPTVGVIWREAGLQLVVDVGEARVEPVHVVDEHGLADVGDEVRKVGGDGVHGEGGAVVDLVDGVQEHDKRQTGQEDHQPDGHAVWGEAQHRVNLDQR